MQICQCFDVPAHAQIVPRSHPRQELRLALETSVGKPGSLQ
jgi:hypothetical protein